MHGEWGVLVNCKGAFNQLLLTPAQSQHPSTHTRARPLCLFISCFFKDGVVTYICISHNYFYMYDSIFVEVVKVRPSLSGEPSIKHMHCPIPIVLCIVQAHNVTVAYFPGIQCASVKQLTSYFVELWTLLKCKPCTAHSSRV